MKYYVFYNCKCLAVYKSLKACFKFIIRKGLKDDYCNELFIADEFHNKYRFRKSSVMKKLLMVAVLMLFGIATMNGQSREFKCEGTTYTSVKSVGSRSAEPEKTPYQWEDSKGQSYPIYISKSGSCYTIRVSKKTGKEYKSYLGKEISADICKKMGREYTPRK